MYTCECMYIHTHKHTWQWVISYKRSNIVYIWNASYWRRYLIYISTLLICNVGCSSVLFPCFVWTVYRAFVVCFPHWCFVYTPCWQCTLCHLLLLNVVGKEKKPLWTDEACVTGRSEDFPLRPVLPAESLICVRCHSIQSQHSIINIYLTFSCSNVTQNFFKITYYWQNGGIPKNKHLYFFNNEGWIL